MFLKITNAFELPRVKPKFPLGAPQSQTISTNERVQCNVNTPIPETAPDVAVSPSFVGSLHSRSGFTSWSLCNGSDNWQAVWPPDSEAFPLC